jgi:hypothetical protein
MRPRTQATTPRTDAPEPRRADARNITSLWREITFLRYFIPFVILALSLQALASSGNASLFAIGCDPFGYSRQAELFRENGLWRGLDTRIKDADASTLISAAKSIDSNSANWYQAIAPHCHYYRASSDSVILQYPPGTGFLLSLFPPATSLDVLFPLIVASVTATIVIAVAGSQATLLNYLLGGIVLVPLVFVEAAPEAAGNPSVPATIAFIPMMALFAREMDSHGRLRRHLIAFLIGVCAGLLFAIRSPNIVLSFSLFVCILINFWPHRTSASHFLYSMFWFIIAFFTFGALPVLSANFINTGNALTTTYSEIDAAPPDLRLDVIFNNLKFYLTSGYALPVVVSAALVLVFRVVTIGKLRPAGGRYGLSIGGGGAFALTLAYFCTHDIRQPYYVYPAAALSLCLVCFELMGSRPADVADRRKLTGGVAKAATLSMALVGVALVAGFRLSSIEPKTTETTIPDELKSNKSIVWADISSGTIYYYQHKYAAKLNFSKECTREMLVRAVFDRGLNQYFVVDSEDMKEVVGDISKLVPLPRAGVVMTYDALDVYKLPSDAVWTGQACAKS